MTRRANEQLSGKVASTSGVRLANTAKVTQLLDEEDASLQKKSILDSLARTEELNEVRIMSIYNGNLN